jgi:hypothetical protein
MEKIINFTTANGSVDVISDELILVTADLKVRTTANESAFLTTDSLATILAKNTTDFVQVTPIDLSGAILINTQNVRKVLTVTGGTKIIFRYAVKPIIVSEASSLILPYTTTKKATVLVGLRHPNMEELRLV